MTAARPIISFVVAMTDDRVIGRGNDLPWHIPDDMAHFKRLTLGKPVIMGRRNYESIGRPLPQRHNIVMTRQQDYTAEGCTVVHGVDEALAACGDADEIMVIGGQEIYRAFMPLANRLYLTIVHAEIEGDTWFSSFDPGDWIEHDRVERGVGPRTPYPLTYLQLERA